MPSDLELISRQRRRRTPSPRQRQTGTRSTGGSFGDFTFTLTLGNFLPTLFSFGRRFPARQPGSRLQALPTAQPGAPSSTNPFPSGARPPPFGKFPKGFGANDPIFDLIKKSKAVFKGIPVLGRVVDVADVLVAVTEKIQLESMADILRRQDIELADIAAAAIKKKQDRDRLARADLEATKLEQAPESIPDFDESQRPAPAPQTTPVPSFPAGIPVPDTIGLPLPRTTPVPSIDPPRLPRVDTRPSPTTRTGGQRSRLPDIDLGSNPLIDRLLSQTPQEINLTSVQSTVPSSAIPRTTSQIGRATALNPQSQLNLATQRCPARRCDDDLDEPRIECFKGLYKETANDTLFTEWAQINCLTGEEI